MRRAFPPRMPLPDDISPDAKEDFRIKLNDLWSESPWPLSVGNLKGKKVLRSILRKDCRRLKKLRTQPKAAPGKKFLIGLKDCQVLGGRIIRAKRL